MKVLIQDIAKKANVSSGTVSNALNNRKGISEEKRDCILKIAREMGYFKKSKNNVIRLLMLNKKARVLGDTPFFSELIRGIETECSAQGFELLINQIYSDISNKLAVEEILKQESVDGILLLGTEMELYDLAFFEKLSVPIVVLDTVFKDQRFDYVAINNVDAAYDVVTYMIKKGHINIGIINSSQQINNFRERKVGYYQALENNNLNIYPENEALVDPSLEGAYHDMKIYLQEYIKESENIPTAFFAVNDNIALGAMKAIQEMGFDHTSIVGFDDLPLCNFCNPPLTTVRVDKQYLGKTAIARLIEKINKNDIGIKKILVGTEIIQRDSVKEI